MTRRVEALVWGSAVVFLVVGVLRARRLDEDPVVQPVALAPVRPLTPRPTADRLSEASAQVIRGDLFRLDRTPAPLGFQADETGQEAATAPPAVRPPLAVQGIIGPPWTAVLAGIPGHSRPWVVHTGDTVGDFKITSVTRDTVIVAGPDTVWILTVRKPWQRKF